MGRVSAVLFSVLMVLSVVAGGGLATAPATGEVVEPTVDDASTASETSATTSGLTSGAAMVAQSSDETDDGNRPPTVEFGFAPSQPEPGQVVEFSAEASDPDGSVEEYEWHVDGTPIASGPTAEHAFTASGTHEVRLTITDDRGGTASLTRLVSVAEDGAVGETSRVRIDADPVVNPEFAAEKPARGHVIPFRSGPVKLDPGLDGAVLETQHDRAWTVFQFHTQPTREELDLLASWGYQQRSVLTDDTYYAAIPPENAASAIELESVRAIADVEPGWKVDPALSARLSGDAAAELRVTVRTFEEIPAVADSLGLRTVRDRTYRGALTPTQIRDLQQRERVRWIEGYEKPEPLLEESVGVIGADAAAFPGVDGSGVRVGVVDTGIEHGHPHFSGVTVVDSYDKRDDDSYPEADNYGWDKNDHGTHVAGTIAGGSVVDGKSLVGVAPEATLVVARGLGEDQFDRVHNERVDIISNSWGSRSQTGSYSADDEYTDRWARAHPESLLVVANGNYNGSVPAEQYANTPGVAKNVISVGAINDGSATTDKLNNIAWLNNMSWPDDGRQKPDVNAPGAWINSSVLNSTYGTKPGTSMATPHVSGVAALYEDEYQNRGPDANEIKAAMVATTGPVENPDPSERAEGYGAVNAHNMLYNNSYESRQIHYQGDLKPPFPTANTHKFDVASDAQKVVVSLSWLDPPGDPATTDTLVNDLDLYVGPTNDPKRYSVTDRDQSVNRLVVDSLSSAERGTQWVVTVEPHDMWTGIGMVQAKQDYDGTIRVITEEPDVSVEVPDRIVLDPQWNVTTSFETRIDAKGAPVHGIRAFVDGDASLRDCGPSNAHDEEHVVGIQSEDYPVEWSEQLCFDVRAEWPNTYPVTTTVNYTDPTGQTATIEKETVIEVAKPRVSLEPVERNVSVGERTEYDLVARNVGKGVSAFAVNISLDDPRIGRFTDVTVDNRPANETVQFDPGQDSNWVTVEADGFYESGPATLGTLEAEGAALGKSNISIVVTSLQAGTGIKYGDEYPLRPQVRGGLSGVHTDGVLNVTEGPITIVPPGDDDGDDSSITVDTPVSINVDVSAVTTQFDAEPVAVEWDLGDGTVATGLQTEHAYAEPGTYEIVGSVLLSTDETVTVSRTVSVEPEKQGTASIDTSSKVVEAAVGERVDIPITLQNTDRASLGIGSESADYHVQMEIQDGNGDGRVSLRWNTRAAGETTDVREVFSTAADADSVTNVERTTGHRQGSLVAEAYPVILRVDGVETDVGTVSLTEPDDGICGKSESTLIEAYNENTEQIPGFALGMVTDETIVLRTEDGSQPDYTVITGAEGRISTVQDGPPTDPTVAVETDCETIASIAEAENTDEAFADAYNNGEIAIHGTTIGKTIVVEILKIGIDIGNMLGLF